MIERKFKVIVVGDPSVGKTTLIKKYTTGEFQEDYISTLGAQFSKYEETIDGEKADLIIWDIAGQEAFEIMRKKFYTGSNGAIIVFSHSLDEVKSFKNIKMWYKEVLEYCGEIPIILFGNKLDLIDEDQLVNNSSLPTSDAKVTSFLETHSILGYSKTSALTGEGVTESFRILIKKLLSTKTESIK